MTLIVKPCSYQAAKWAVARWYHSPAMPSGKSVSFGAWEDEEFVGVVIYGSGANKDLVKPYGLTQFAGCELTRAAFNSHKAPITQIVAESLRLLRISNPDLRLIVTFVDPEQNHVGGVYQAGNWIYAGMTQASEEYLVNGKRWQGRSLRMHRQTHPQGGVEASNALEWAKKVLDPNACVVMGSSKYRYLYPMDKGMRRKIEKLRLPYPRAVEDSLASRIDTIDEGQVRSLPTAPLSTETIQD